MPDYSIGACWYMLDPMSTQTVRLHRWDEIALEKVTEMLSRKIVTGEREMLAQIYLKRGCLVPMHSHEAEQMTYILQGALKFLIGGEEITVRETIQEGGDVIGVRAVTKSGETVEVYAPMTLDGLPAGQIAERLDIPSPTLSFHLAQLRHAGLVQVRRDGRSLIYAANYDGMNGLMEFLTDNCCAGDGSCRVPICEPEKATIVRRKPRRTMRQ